MHASMACQGLKFESTRLGCYSWTALKWNRKHDYYMGHLYLLDTIMMPFRDCVMQSTKDPIGTLNLFGETMSPFKLRSVIIASNQYT